MLPAECSCNILIPPHNWIYYTKFIENAGLIFATKKPQLANQKKSLLWFFAALTSLPLPS